MDILVDQGPRYNPGTFSRSRPEYRPYPHLGHQPRIEHGADVNRFFPWFGDEKFGFTPLSWAVEGEKSRIAEYLRSKGARMPEEKPAVKGPGPKGLADQVVAYFNEHFGPVHAKSAIEIVPSGPPIAVHVIPAGKDRNHVTLFTTGMSEQPMNVPEGEEEFRYAELFIQLPEKWPLTKEKLKDPNYGWPIHWLRSTAKYPHQQQTWLGGPVTIVARSEPPQRFAPNVPFTSMLLLAEQSFVANDGRTIQLYRLVPLYTEERELEKREGVAALMREFDRSSIPFVVDLKRKNVGLG